MKRLIAALLLLSATLPLSAQSLAPGDREISFWAGGGHSVSGGRSDVGVFNAGLRYGWVLTGPAGPGFLRGTFEYAVDAIPLYVIFQNGATYGASFDPLGLKWNFANAHRVAPFIELAGGVLFSNHDVPRFTNDVNFTSQAAFGVHLGERKWRPTLQVRFVHISNAGLATPNPGVNTVQFQLGLAHFTHSK